MAILKTLTVNGVTYSVTPVVPASSVTLRASAWVSDGDAYSQVVEIPGVTSHTKVDLQPTSEQLVEFHYKVLAFVAENSGGTVTVYAIGDKPANDHTIQITKTEVEGTGKIRGNTVGTSMPRPDWNQNDPTKADYIKNKPDVSKVGTPDVYAAEFDFHSNTLSKGSFSEMLDAFQADKVVTLSYINPVGNEFCFYCTYYDIGYESKEHLEFVGNEFGEYTTICVYPDGRITMSKVSIGGSVELDTTLTQAGKAADAKAVGDRIADELNRMNHHFLFNYGYMKTEYGFRSIYGGITLDNGYISQIVEVEAEDVLSVTCTTPASVGFAAVIFYDGSMNVVSYEKANADNNSYSYTDLIVKVPANAKYAATSSPYQYECKIGKLTMEQTALLLRGKTIVNFGDSIFGNEHDDTSVSSLLAKATFANCVNCGFGGTKMINRMLIAGSTNSGYEEFDFENLVNAIVSGNYQSQKNAISWYSLPDYYQGSLYLLEKIDFSKVDIVTLNFGTNDYTYGEKVATFKTKYAEAVAKLQSAFPNLNVVIISPTWRCWLNADGSFQEDSNTKIWWSTGDSTLVDYCNTLQEMAKELNVQYIDVYNIGINKNTWSHYFTAADTTHQNIKGRKRIASVVAKNLC